MQEQDFAETVRQFNAAEDEMAKYGGLSIDDQLAAVNELRYVGHHVLKAAAADISEPQRLDNLRSAKKHGQRACNDVRDDAIIVNLTSIRDFLERQYTSSEMSTEPQLSRELFRKVLELRRKLENAGMPNTFTPGCKEEVDIKEACGICTCLKDVMSRLDQARDKKRRHKEYMVSHHRWSVLRESKRRARAAYWRRISMLVMSFMLSVFSLATLLVAKWS